MNKHILTNKYNNEMEANKLKKKKKNKKKKTTTTTKKKTYIKTSYVKL